MAINSLDTLIAGFEPPIFFQKGPTGSTAPGRAVSSWPLAGFPGAGSYSTSLAGEVCNSASLGSIKFVNPTGGEEAYLAKGAVQLSTGTSGSIVFCDRLWHNGGINATSTSVQSFTSTTWPARDINGSTNGEGVYLALEVSSITGSGTPVITVEYTNSDGTTGRSANTNYSTSSSSPAGTFYAIALQDGDKGVRSVQSVKLSSTWTSGTINLVAYRPIAITPIGFQSASCSLDPIMSGLPRVYNDSSLFFFYTPIGTASIYMSGYVQLAKG